MVLIRLFDGTSRPEFGRSLTEALSEIEKYQSIDTTPTPGQLDRRGYRIVRATEKKAFDVARRQVHFQYLVTGIINSCPSENLGKNAIILTEEDLYSNGLNWCFGGVTSNSFGGRHLAISTRRMQNLETFTHVATHELGHMFGAASVGRKNTKECLGNHCTNSCVMEQQLTIPDMVGHQQRLKERSNKFCSNCILELRRYR